MPDGTKLGRAKLRGVESNGMILSEQRARARRRPRRDHRARRTAPRRARRSPRCSPIAEPVIELEPTSNRVDCFGVYGVAREVHAITGAELAPRALGRATPRRPGEGAVERLRLGRRSRCRSSARASPPASSPTSTIGPSPPWLKARLTAAGMRPINNVVDITNYVMLMTAQPLHAFDLDKVPGGEIIVRTAREGETMTTLDGVERSFDAETVLVCDRDGPTGIAGIMGGQVSEVSETTTRVLLEVATWNGVNILRTSRKLGLRSDASNRFEKQLHPELAMRAQRVASRLMVELCGARLVPGHDRRRRARSRSRTGSGCAAGAPSACWGCAIPPERRVEYLRRLEFEVEPDGDDLEAIVPLHRHYDVTREADLVEEVGRIHGYADHLPSTLPAERAGRRGSRREQRAAPPRRGRDPRPRLRPGRDAQPRRPRRSPARLRIAGDDPRAQPIAISNPLSREHSVLRTTLLGGLLDVARHNLAHGAERVALSESGRAYLRDGRAGSEGTLGGGFPGERPAPAYEPQRLACLASGPLPRRRLARATPASRTSTRSRACSRRSPRSSAARSSVEAGDRAVPASRAARAGSSSTAPRPAGSASCIRWSAARGTSRPRPRSSSTWRRWSPRRRSAREQYEDVITYPGRPPGHRGRGRRGRRGRARARRWSPTAGGELLRSVEIFDLYRGEQVGEGRKSLALRLEFRAADRTLTDEEVAAVRERIKEALAEIGGSLRE